MKAESERTLVQSTTTSAAADEQHPDAKPQQAVLSDNAKKEIDAWLEKFPEGREQSAVLAALTIAQKEAGGWLSEPLMNCVADYLKMPHIAIYEVATFYSLFDLHPVGQHKIHICTNISCMLAGSDKMVEYVEQKLQTKVGETTADGKFTLHKSAECLAACAQGPMMQVDGVYYENLTEEKIDTILNEVKA